MDSRASQFDTYLDGDMRQEQFAEFCEALRSDAEFANSFARYVLMENHLREHLSFERAGSIALTEQPDAADRPRDRDTRDTPQSSDAPNIGSAVRRSWLQSASRHPLPSGIAVAIIGIAALLAVLAFTPMSQFFADGKGDKHNELQPAAAQEIATLTGWHRIDWKEGHRVRGSEHRLRAGQSVAMLSGLAEITYDTGAKVVIEGPAEFIVGVDDRGLGDRGAEKSDGGSRESDVRSSIPSRQFTANSGFLKQGKLVALVEGEEAQGFIIETPSARIEDLGTEFGVEVLATGTTLSSVYRGKVEVRTLVGSQTIYTLRADDGLRLASNGEVKRMTTPLKLVRSFRHELQSTGDELRIVGDAADAIVAQTRGTHSIRTYSVGPERPFWRIGSAGSDRRSRQLVVYYFALPRLTDRNEIVGASLQFHYLERVNEPSFAVDAYGLKPRDEPLLHQKEFVLGDDMSRAQLLSRAILHSESRTGIVELNNDALLHYIRGSYAKDGSPHAKFACIRLNPDYEIDDDSTQGYRVALSETERTNFRPVLALRFANPGGDESGTSAEHTE